MRIEFKKEKLYFSNCLRVTMWLSMILLFFPFSKVNSQTFGNIAMGGGGFISGIITSKTEKDLIYVRTDVGGAYRWDATMGEWIPLLDWISSSQLGYLGVESVAIDPTNPNNLYMSVGLSYFNNGNSVILRSTDKGNTFSITNVTNLSNKSYLMSCFLKLRRKLFILSPRMRILYYSFIYILP